MAEDLEHNSTPSATPASNQNLIIGIVMGAVVLLLLLLVMSQQTNGFWNKSNDDEVTALKEKLEELKDNNEAIKQDIRTLPGGQDANILIGNIKRDADALVQHIAANQGELARLRGSEATQRDLYAKIGSLQSELAQARGAQGQLASLQAPVSYTHLTLPTIYAV